MQLRNQEAIDRIDELRQSIFNNQNLNDILKRESLQYMMSCKTPHLISLERALPLSLQAFLHHQNSYCYLKNKRNKKCIKTLQKRDYLSITPKLEDIALVNRWIENFNVPHYYLQVFFDKAYIISFEDILNISSNPSDEGVKFSIERDNKNQGKTTIKIDVRSTDLIIDQVAIPDHASQMKELDRGRVLFYVKFDGTSGYLEETTLESVLR